MTDETLESNSNEGSTESPNSAASQVKNVSSTSMLQPEQLEQYVSKAVEKALQSQKDKRFSGIEKTLDGFKPVLEQVKSLLTPQQLAEFNQIQKDAEFEELKRVVYGKASTGTPATGNQQSTATVIEVLKQFPELDANDPDVVSKVLSLTDAKEAELAIHRLVRQRSNPTPVSASAVSPVQGTPNRSAGVEELTKQYKQAMQAAKGKPSELRSIKDEYLKKGVDIYNVNFS